MHVDRDEEERKNKAGKEQNEFINQRLTWLGTFESLLFAADHFGTNSRWLPIVLPLMGLAFAISVGVGTFAANLALEDIGREAFHNRPELKKWGKLMPGTAIPVIIGIAWIPVLFERVLRYF